MAECILLVGAGVVLGTVAAIIAVLPALGLRAQVLPVAELAGMLAAVVIAGALASLFAVRVATSIPVVGALKAE